MANNNTSTILSDVKKILGYGTNKLDTPINNFILAGKKDLEEAGVVSSKIVETDPLIYSALVSYVLSMIDTYEFRELSANAYFLQKNQLRHYGDYNGSETSNSEV